MCSIAAYLYDIMPKNNCIVTGAKVSTPPDSDDENLQHNLDFQPQNDEEDLPQYDESNVSH
jgi:hypothetical protein